MLGGFELYPRWVPLDFRGIQLIHVKLHTESSIAVGAISPAPMIVS